MKKVLCLAFALCMIVASFGITVSAIVPVSDSYIIDGDKHITIPTMFETQKAVTEFAGSKLSSLNDPKDLFYDVNGYYYIADTGNNRILKLNEEFQVLSEVCQAGDTQLSAPTGVSVDSYGDVYIADSGNSRIVHLNSDFTYIESFVKPDSDLLYDVEFFSPSKVSFDSVSNFLYVIQGKQFMKIDALNNFKGYIGDNKVGFDLWDYLFRKFATRKQKMQVEKRAPESYTNFCLGGDGRLYAVGLAENQRISVINTVGNNIYPSGSYGELNYDSYGAKIAPIFTDIAVNSYGIIFVSEENTGHIYQYDNEGNLLGVFGGKGEGKSTFNIVSSMVIGKDNYLVTLDSALGRIQAFKPTQFTDTVHKAIALYADGKYDDSYKLWLEVRSKNANYILARQMIGSIDYKNENYSDAKQEFYQGEDQENYGKVFERLRYNLFQENFGIVVIAFAVILTLIIVIIKLSKAWIARLRADLWERKDVR